MAAATNLRRLSGLFSSIPKPSSKPKPISQPKRVRTTDPSSKSKFRTTMIALFKEADPDKFAAGFLSAAAASGRFRSRHRVYEVAIQRLALARRPDLVHSVLDSHKNFLTDISREGFTLRLIRLYGKAGMASHGASLYEDLPSLNCPRTVMSFNALLTAYFHSNDMEALAKAFVEIPEKDPSIVLNSCSYNILINALCEKSEFEKAMNVLNLMEKCGVQPDRITFSSLLNGLYKNGKIDEGDEVWEIMKEKNVEPDVEAFNAKIKGLILAGKSNEAVEIVEQMKHDGPKPEINTFNMLISDYLTNGNLNKARDVYSDILENNCVPSKKTYKMIIPCLVELGELDMALGICHDVLKKNCYIDAEIIQGVVEGLARVSRREEAEKLVEAGRKNGYSKEKLFVPNEQCENL
ncbi:hypothetical protein LUZ60_001415 [Juncus effusus]|nr:hypothetical protein LUZ60_001415 [Juncus effusus]